MATLLRESGTLVETPAEIEALLGPVGVTLTRVPVDVHPDMRPLIALAAPDADQKARILGATEPLVREMPGGEAFKTLDLVCLSPDTPNLDGLLLPFQKPHRHDDHETRYIVDGEGLFGFVLGDGEQVLLRVVEGDYLTVPAGSEHWFTLTERRRIKAVRCFTDTAGWVPRYTETAIRITS